MPSLSDTVPARRRCWLLPVKDDPGTSYCLGVTWTKRAMQTCREWAFGVEIELLLGSKKKHSSWKGLATQVSKRLNRAGLDVFVNDQKDKSARVYQTWSISPEITIKEDAAKGHYGIELVSPKYNLYSKWIDDLDTIFAVLGSSFVVVASPSCGTHIHISTEPAMEAQEVCTLAKMILSTEPAFDALMPVARRASARHWCQSNRAGSAFLGSKLTLEQCFQVVDLAARDGGVAGVVAALNTHSPEAGSGFARATRGRLARLSGQRFKWNLAGLVNEGVGTRTMEFRQPPGSVTADGVRGWVELTLGFVEGGLRRSESGCQLEAWYTVDDLWDLVQDGVAALQLRDEWIGGIFSARQA
ncbi:hypothetical protein MGG_10956 [Pyricularia oryzae 70-15]|uniref:Amidoligase enzyme n=1 Tax=Pyricularia oryzae (strain 70-15 / ATCC MYA-4617 / FGSC 8958) TaxID=242507 RepID=G4NBW7_PYRO7|nr:uncharacterized protein MGG_10956 [Pyricularia oryzae 70-15]EHA48169.1 hypothetical protein MGG_10956 [Pyricularia oryzae 70-15]